VAHIYKSKHFATFLFIFLLPLSFIFLFRPLNFRLCLAWFTGTILHKQVIDVIVLIRTPSALRISLAFFKRSIQVVRVAFWIQSICLTIVALILKFFTIRWAFRMFFLILWLLFNVAPRCCTCAATVISYLSILRALSLQFAKSIVVLLGLFTDIDHVGRLVLALAF
jgi:hypothetical protein